jgi:hypothetical protein
MRGDQPCRCSVRRRLPRAHGCQLGTNPARINQQYCQVPKYQISSSAITADCCQQGQQGTRHLRQLQRCRHSCSHANAHRLPEMPPREGSTPKNVRAKGGTMSGVLPAALLSYCWANFPGVDPTPLQHVEQRAECSDCNLGVAPAITNRRLRSQRWRPLQREGEGQSHCCSVACRG